MRPFTLTAIIGLALAFAPRGHAAESLKAREKAAKKACAAGDFRKGVDILAELYVDTNNATYVFNQGRCYQQNHQWVSAIDRFREFQRKTPDATPSSQAEVEKHIADCEAFRAQEEPRQLPTPLTPPPLPAPVVSPAPEQEKIVVTQPAEPKADQGRGLRVSGIILGSVGAASAVAGLALNLKANSLAKDYNRDKDAGTRSSHSTYKTGSMIGYGAGAGLLATGVVLYLIGRSAAAEGSTQVSFMPLLTATGVSLSARREF